MERLPRQLAAWLTRQAAAVLRQEPVSEGQVQALMAAEGLRWRRECWQVLLHLQAPGALLLAEPLQLVGFWLLLAGSQAVVGCVPVQVPGSLLDMTVLPLTQLGLQAGMLAGSLLHPEAAAAPWQLVRCWLLALRQQVRHLRALWPLHLTQLAGSEPADEKMALLAAPQAALALGAQAARIVRRCPSAATPARPAGHGRRLASQRC